MNSTVKNIIRFFLFIGLQAYVLDEIPPISQFVVPYVYFLFILWLPFTINRFVLLISSFLLGLSLDYIGGTPGLHAAPCVLIAFLRPYLLNLLIPQQEREQSYMEPSFKSMGFAPYSLYVILLTFIHHIYLVLIEWLQFGNLIYFLGKITFTTLTSLLLIFIAELIFPRKGKFRTNAV